MRHRNYVYVLVLLVAGVTLIGGAFNDVSAHGRVLDESSGDPVAGAQAIYGIRVALTDANGNYVLDHLPRGARYAIQSRGYDPGSGDTSTTEVKLHPFALALQVNEKDSGDPASPVPKPEIRQGDTRVGGPGTDTGSVVAAPYPDIGSQLLVCAPDHDTATIAARGGAATPLVVVLAKGTQGCPALPTPSPTPTPSASPSASPSSSASPTPTPSPSPSKTP
jgi:hypothetical protein